MSIPVDVVVEVVNPYAMQTIYVSVFATIVAFSSVAYQLWRDYVSTKPKLRVLTRVSENNLSIGVVNHRSSVILEAIGLCVIEEGGTLRSAPVISRKFTVLAGNEVRTFENVLPSGFGPDLEKGRTFKVFVEIASGEKFYSEHVKRPGA